MRVYRKFLLARKCLRLEDELKLGYLYSNPEFTVGRSNKKNSILVAILVFLNFLKRHFKFREVKVSHCDTLSFVGTNNQLNSIQSTDKALKKLNIKNALLLGQDVQNKKNIKLSNAVEVCFGISDILCALIIFLYRSAPLLWGIKKKANYPQLKKYLHVFYQAYIYLPYFLKVIDSTGPKLIIMSNDHNISNRCLRLSAGVLGVETLYMQHASISELFPPLEFNYALLDGKVALDIYSRCYKNAIVNNRVKRNVRNCVIYLSGQKKIISKQENHEKDCFCIGIGINALDDIEVLLSRLNNLLKAQVICFIRTHPFQDKEDIEKIKNYLCANVKIQWSNPQEDSLSNFFSRINCLIAGNTSLHLEAALVNIPTFYWNISKKDNELDDYYGYVKSGVSYSLERVEIKAPILNKLSEEWLCDSQRIKALKEYSETYGTKWQNKEGELSASIIKSLISISQSNEFFCYKSDVYDSIYRLKP